ncbi:aquaporin 12 isoform X2 [Salvelinus sp. IW2-2015]|uniref:aquaporin 12 isoform X2 n=1 Tax=Salvelinus sp. IW2-2015 TaxID=2691554 RepID=UPI000CDFDA7D|nr:aquaporin-12-like [Salvelinus alpinus]
MSGLNVTLGYFLAVVVFGAAFRTLFRKWPRLSVAAEFPASFVLVACWLEVQTIKEVGEWAGGLGPDVTLTILFLVLLTHGVICAGATGNPSLTLMNFLLLETHTLPTLLALAAQFLGAHLALLGAGYYWALELNDMHMIKNLMSRECSTALRVSLVQGVISECVCAFIFYLIYLSLKHRSALIRVPLVAAVLTFFSHSASDYTMAFLNPSLAYGLTFYCPGFTFTEYSVVYWLGPIFGMTLALLLYMGHIPRIFTKNLLYSQKTRFRVPKGEGDKKK